MSSWSSGDPAFTKYANQSSAPILAFEKYIEAIERAGVPQSMNFGQGQVGSIEFAHARTASLKAMGRLVVEVLEENILTLAEATGRTITEMGWSPTADREVRPLLRSVKVTQAFGLAEATLLHSRRLLSALNATLSTTDEQVLKAVDRVLLRHVEGTGASRGLALVLADEVVSMIDAALSKYRDTTPQPLDDQTTSEAAGANDD